MKITNINNTPTDLTVGYTWDKGGYEKYLCVIDNTTRTIYYFGTPQSTPPSTVQVFNALCRIYKQDFHNIQYKGKPHRLCHDDDLGDSYKRGYTFKGDWKDF